MNKVILIVDDDPKSLKLTGVLLKASGYEILEATDGEQGVELAREEKPDLILMDIMMPRMDGYTACDAIKRDEATKGIPVVMLTAIDYVLNKELAVRMKADGYLTKPFNRQHLLDEVNRYLPAS